MNLAKAFKKQAEDDSRAHVNDFESAVASRQAALTRILEDQVNMLYEALLILQMNSLLIHVDHGKRSVWGSPRLKCCLCIMEGRWNRRRLHLHRFLHNL